MKTTSQVLLVLLTAFASGDVFAFPDLIAMNGISSELDTAIANPATKKNSPVAVQPGAPQSDTALSSQITNQLRSQGYDMNRIQVTVIDGKVIVNGAAPSRTDAASILESARIANGGSSVTDNLKVSHP